MRYVTFDELRQCPEWVELTSNIGRLRAKVALCGQSGDLDGVKAHLVELMALARHRDRVATDYQNFLRECA